MIPTRKPSIETVTIKESPPKQHYESQVDYYFGIVERALQTSRPSTTKPKADVLQVYQNKLKMSALRGFVVLGGIAAVPLSLVYGQAARQLSTRASNAYSRRTGVFASLPANTPVDPEQAEKDRLRAARRAEIQEGIRSELEWLHQNDLTCTL
ncbi:hypothetical protein CBER1_07261 [Cercospora berteroae]|uniref:Uncharacterized protein n=1 Tax=Cercospora berteroae TaxID=357750 RepID=A0A2S6BTR0_9PEZI|nr:hypothetical protein CBER1_07261 [Cercospora berteroae]